MSGSGPGWLSSLSAPPLAVSVCRRRRAGGDRRGTKGQRPRCSVPVLPRQTERWLERRLVPLVLVVAVFGVAFPNPGRRLASADGIPVALALLVASTGVSITLGQLRQARAATGRLTVIVAITSVVLPAMAWAASHLTGPGPLRDGVLTTGVAPAEVASVALAGIGGGEAALTAALLVGSTLVTVLAAGPILAALGTAATVSSTALLTQLTLVVALPLATGITTRATLRLTRSALSAGAAVGTLALLVLLWQVATQSRYGAPTCRSPWHCWPSSPAAPPSAGSSPSVYSRHADSRWPSQSACETSLSRPGSPPPPSAPRLLRHWASTVSLSCWLGLWPRRSPNESADRYPDGPDGGYSGSGLASGRVLVVREECPHRASSQRRLMLTRRCCAELPRGALRRAVGERRGRER